MPVVAIHVDDDVATGFETPNKEHEPPGPPVSCSSYK